MRAESLLLFLGQVGGRVSLIDNLEVASSQGGHANDCQLTGCAKVV